MIDWLHPAHQCPTPRQHQGKAGATLRGNSRMNNPSHDIDIISWLSSVSTPTSARKTRKRKQSVTGRSSTAAMGPTEDGRRSSNFLAAGDGDGDGDGSDNNEAPVTPKRPRLVDTATDQTPRPHAAARSKGSSASSRVSRSSSNHTRGSGTSSSPRKKLVALSMEPQGIERRVLARSAPGIPAKLVDFLTKMEAAAYGPGIISSTQKVCGHNGLFFSSSSRLTWLTRTPPLQQQAMIEQINQDSSLGDMPFDFLFGDAETRDSIGPTPSLPDVVNILDDAMWCQETGQFEHGWNCAVHFSLLRLALHGPGRRKRQLVDFTPW